MPAIEIKFEESDLKSFGTTTYPYNNIHTSFLFSTGGVEVLIFRKLMIALGYKIISEKDFVWENGNCDLEIKTNYPWNRYMTLSSS